MSESPPGADAPLTDLRVVVTRPLHQAQELVRAFRNAGAVVEQLPLLTVVPPEDPAPFEAALADLSRFRWVVFTSANAVDALAGRLEGELSPGVSVAVVGPATRAAAREHGLAVALTAGRSDAEGLLEALGSGVSDVSVLVPQAADARPTLVEGLRRAGAEVTAVTAYDKQLPAESESRAAELFAEAPIGWVTCTSPRIVRHLVKLLKQVLGERFPDRLGELKAASIGPITSRELRRFGVEPLAEAARPGNEALVAAVVAAEGAARDAG